MKRIALTLLVVCSGMLVAQQVIAQDDYRFALGLRLSNSFPTLNNAVTAKYFATNTTAIEGIVSWGSRFGIGALLELHRPFSTPGLSWFYGGGVYAGFQDSDTYLGPTGIIGLDYKFSNVPVNLSVDWKPELDIIPSINFVPDAFAFSIRFALK